MYLYICYVLARGFEPVTHNKYYAWLCISMDFVLHNQWFNREREMHGCGSYNPFARFSNGQMTFMPSLWSREKYDQVPRWLRARGTLTILRFSLLVRLHPVPGYNMHWECVPGSCTQRCVL
jgi:hypothetical protein